MGHYNMSPFLSQTQSSIVNLLRDGWLETDGSSEIYGSIVDYLCVHRSTTMLWRGETDAQCMDIACQCYLLLKGVKKQADQSHR